MGTPLLPAESDKLSLDQRTGELNPAGGQASLFNPFYVFKYTGGTTVLSEEAAKNLSLWYNNSTSDSTQSESIRIFNPTAENIINWAKNSSWTSVSRDGIGYSPYTWTDFIFCKYYGIIPNNRLVTLRRYPLGVDDKAFASNPTVNNIPVAQAVTWFGDVSGNELKGLWQNKWSIPWTAKSTNQVQDVQGNEITNFSQGLAKAFSGSNDNFSKLLSVVATISDGFAAYGESNVRDVRKAILEKGGQAGIQGKIQALAQNAYSDTGAFWNQIAGPVNVLTEFNIRARGLSNDAIRDPVVLKFAYRTDSYFGLSQRRVALDILANMMALTYSDGEWLANISAYYESLGIALTKDEQGMFNAALNDGSIDVPNLVKAITATTQARLSAALTYMLDAGKEGIDFIYQTGNVLGGLAIGGQKKDNGKLGAEDFDLNVFRSQVGAGGDAYATFQKNYPNLSLTIETAMVDGITKALPAFIQKRAAVSNVSTGNWHLTIGNPMHPIMRYGNLAVSAVTCDFNDELGPEDFPTEMVFTVTLLPMQPRDGKGLRRIFDIGKRDYVDPYGGVTSDQVNTFGANAKRMSDLSNGAENVAQSLTPGGQTSNQAARQADPNETFGGQGNIGSSKPGTKADAVMNWIRAKYGDGSATSTKILTPGTIQRLNNVYFYVPDITAEGIKFQRVYTQKS